jgi:prophage antirepressor-like protein
MASNILEIANSRDAMTQIDEGEKVAVGLTDAGKALVDAGFDITRVRTINLINESGMYTLILG